MAICSRAATMDRLCGVIATQPKNLWSLIFRIVPNLLGLPASFLLKKFRKKEHFHPPLMELGAALPELPRDVLMDIFATLEVPDLLRAGSICLSWHSASTCLRDLGNCKQSQVPCLFYTSESAGENIGFLYSLKENRSYKLTLPEPPIRSRFLIGSSNGWLITADERSELHLVNPITGEQIALPSVVTIEQVKPIFDLSGTIHKYELSYDVLEVDPESPSLHDLSDLREFLYFKVFLFPDASTGSYIVVLIHAPYFQLSFARVGDDKWTWLPHGCGYSDCIYMDGLLYALKLGGDINAFDLTASTVTMSVIIDTQKGYIYESMYIVQAPWGDLLQVWRTFDVPTDAPEYVPGECRAHTLKIKVYKVDLEGKKLVEINRSPHHILFLGLNDTLCLSAEEHPELKSNQAYFTDDNGKLDVVCKSDTRDMGVMDLENSVKKEIVPKIWSNWPCPTWITPNLTKLNVASRK